MHSVSKFSALFAACLIALADAHGAIISATGNAGGQGTALGIDPSTPRTGTRRRPFQQDTTIFDDQTPQEAQGCGRTLAGGQIQMASAMQTMMGLTGGSMPLVTPGGTVSMMVHQVNADGAGPYTCLVDPTGTGNSFQPMAVLTQVPGDDGRNRDGETTAFPLVAQMPAGVTCTGTMAGVNNLCVVRCQNPANAGPFGGCVPVQMVQPQAQQVAPPVNNGVVNNAPINNGQIQTPNFNNGAVNNVAPVNNGAVNNPAPVNNGGFVDTGANQNSNTVPQQTNQNLNANIPQQVNNQFQDPNQVQNQNQNFNNANTGGFVDNTGSNLNIPQQNQNFNNNGATATANAGFTPNGGVTANANVGTANNNNNNGFIMKRSSRFRGIGGGSARRFARK